MDLMEYKPNECSCEQCARMCSRRPCWPTPDEAKKIIDAGYGDKLMLDWWDADENVGHDIYLVSPACVGSEGDNAPYWPETPCTFFKDGLCELHDLGLKPIEGRLATCNKTNIVPDLHWKVAQTWDNEKAEALVKKWRS